MLISSPCLHHCSFSAGYLAASRSARVWTFFIFLPSSLHTLFSYIWNFLPLPIYLHRWCIPPSINAHSSLLCSRSPLLSLLNYQALPLSFFFLSSSIMPPTQCHPWSMDVVIFPLRTKSLKARHLLPHAHGMYPGPGAPTGPGAPGVWSVAPPGCKHRTLCV